MSVEYYQISLIIFSGIGAGMGLVVGYLLGYKKGRKVKC